MITVEDLLRQLDRVVPSAPGYDHAGLARLMAWMADEDPADRGVAEDETGTRGGGGPQTGKILIAGGERAGSVEFIRKVSEFSTATELALPDEQSVTSAFFGRITLSEDLQLYNIALPNSADRQVWDVLVKGAVGTLVLADPRRLADCHDVLNYLNDCGMPYVLALRGSSEFCPYGLAEIREALRLSGDTPVLFWEPDRKMSARSALIAVVEAALDDHARRSEASARDVPLDEELTALTLLAQLESLLKPTPT
ncbi:hypothetical protein ACFYSF_32520 [Streptomyces canus]|uniref:hypothetical protein n=1 Tax=Streptomyces canus TaxID=58343 RepID=UPI00369E6DC3